MKTLIKITAFCLLACPLWAQMVTIGSGSNIGAGTLICATPSGNTATPVLVPNIGHVGDYAVTSPSPVLAFGKQGITTASAALPVSISNCSNAQYSSMWGICGGSGSLTVSSMAISGANAADFALTGTCSAIASGADCEPTVTFTPTQSSGTSETATLTVNYTGASVSSQTMSLTGTSATVTALPACGSTLAGSTNYQASSDETCPGTAYILGGNNIDVNMGGHTVTFNNTSSVQLATVTAYSGASGTLTLTVGTMGTPFTSGQKVALNFPSTSSPLKGLNGIQYTVLASPAPTATSFAITNATTGSGSASGTVSPDVQTDGFVLDQFNANITIHNGTITSGAGQNVFSDNNHNGAIQENQGYGFTTLGVSNMTLDMNRQFQVGIQGQGTTLHDNILNNAAAGSCAQVGCRDIYQSANMQLSGVTLVYDNTINGGPQGGIQDQGSGTVEYNFINPGNLTGNNTNDFGIYAQGSNLTVSNNVILTPLTADSNSRGILISGAEGSTAGLSVTSNIVGAIETATNFEYGGCEGGGSYGIQWDDGPSSTNASGNLVLATATSDSCASTGLRVTGSTTTTNVSDGQAYTAIRESGAATCTRSPDQGPKPGCANASTWDSPTGFTSINDTFTGDSCDVLFDVVGASGVVMQSPTFNKGSNPSDFYTICAENGTTSSGGGPVSNFHIIDATFNAGTGPTDTDIPFPVPDTPTQNQGPVSAYIDWTQSMTVSKASGGAASGALVTFTDTLGNPYTCTTNISGTCSVAVTQYRDNNDTAANQVENRNPYGLAVSLSGCTTNTSSGLTISATASRSITLSGC